MGFRLGNKDPMMTQINQCKVKDGGCQIIDRAGLEIVRGEVGPQIVWSGELWCWKIRIMS